MRAPPAADVRRVLAADAGYANKLLRRNEVLRPRRSAR
jgi:hypothetical protein